METFKHRNRREEEAAYIVSFCAAPVRWVLWCLHEQLKIQWIFCWSFLLTSKMLTWTVEQRIESFFLRAASVAYMIWFMTQHKFKECIKVRLSHSWCIHWPSSSSPLFTFTPLPLHPSIFTPLPLHPCSFSPLFTHHSPLSSPTRACNEE